MTVLRRKGLQSNFADARSLHSGSHSPKGDPSDRAPAIRCLELPGPSCSSVLTILLSYALTAETVRQRFISCSSSCFLSRSKPSLITAQMNPASSRATAATTLL